MKILLFSILAVGVLATEVLAQAPVPVGPGSVKLGKVDPEAIKSPEYQIVGGPQRRSKTGTWLEIEVAYETKLEEIDELTFTYYALVAGKLLKGAVTYVSIPKGREHYAVMYVAPRMLEKLTAGKPFGPADIQNVWVSVDHQGQIIDQAAVKAMALVNLPQLTGLLNKNETPFAPLFYDRYEAIKLQR
jgi:hypothetical protein